MSPALLSVLLSYSLLRCFLSRMKSQSVESATKIPGSDPDLRSKMWKLKKNKKHEKSNFVNLSENHSYTSPAHSEGSVIPQNMCFPHRFGSLTSHPISRHPLSEHETRVPNIKLQGKKYLSRNHFYTSRCNPDACGTPRAPSPGSSNKWIPWNIYL